MLRLLIQTKHRKPGSYSLSLPLHPLRHPSSLISLGSVDGRITGFSGFIKIADAIAQAN